MIGGRCEECGGGLTPHDHDHEQVSLTSEYGPHVHVDVGIAPLVEACWNLMLATMASCQGNLAGEHLAYLEFAPGGAERFAQLATKATSESKFWRATESALDSRIYDEGLDPAGWRWIPGRPWTPGFIVRFPPSDIPELTRRLNAVLQ
jgi:hypothetical protein